MPRIALTTFLKLWSHNPQRKEAEYRKYLTPGGYDYYWSMKAGVELLTNGSGDLEKALDVPNGLSRASERENNAYGIRTCAELLAAHKEQCFKAPGTSLSSPLKHLAIKIEPEFGIKFEGRRRLVTVWNTKKPEMTRSLAAVGLSLMFDTLVRDEFEDCNCAIYDLRQKRWLIADATTTATSIAIRQELDWVDWLFEKFRTEKESNRSVDQPVRRSL